MGFNSGLKGLIVHAGPEAEGSNPITGLTLLWARNPFGGNFNHWQVSSGAHNCIYSFRYRHPLLLLAATVENGFGGLEVACWPLILN